MCYNELSLSSLSSELILYNVHVEASGEWECVVSTGRGNTSLTVEIVVLENSASFCPEDKVVNNRGEFRLVTASKSHSNKSYIILCAIYRCNRIFSIAVILWC